MFKTKEPKTKQELRNEIFKLSKIEDTFATVIGIFTVLSGIALIFGLCFLFLTLIGINTIKWLLYMYILGSVVTPLLISMFLYVIVFNKKIKLNLEMRK